MWDDYFNTQYGKSLYGNYEKIKEYCSKSRVECVDENHGYRIYMIDGRTTIRIPLSLKYDSFIRKMEYVTDTYCLTHYERDSLALYLTDEFLVKPECIEAKPECMEIEKEKTPEEELEELKSKIETRLKQKEKKVPLEKEYTDKEIIIKGILVFFVTPLILAIGAALITHLGVGG